MSVTTSDRLAAHQPVLAETPPLRIVVLGSSSFIGAAILADAERCGISTLALRGHDDPSRFLEPSDLLVTCGLTSEYRTQPYAPSFDVEARAAESVARHGGRAIMLSTRRVYAADVRWNADETVSADGDGTCYGINKAQTERRVIELLGDRVCILRVSNAFGFEFAPGAPARRSFFGIMLHRLRHSGEILFDMHPDTRRDFIPVAWAARAVLQAAMACESGIYNIGCGGPIRCGDLADAVIAGYGAGTLRATEQVADEFYLDTRKWTDRFGALGELTDIVELARTFGERLHNG